MCVMFNQLSRLGLRQLEVNTEDEQNNSDTRAKSSHSSFGSGRQSSRQFLLETVLFSASPSSPTHVAPQPSLAHCGMGHFQGTDSRPQLRWTHMIEAAAAAKRTNRSHEGQAIGNGSSQLRAAEVQNL